MRYVAAVWVLAGLALFVACGDDRDCDGIICAKVTPDHICCAGSPRPVCVVQENEQVYIGHYCLDTPITDCPEFEEFMEEDERAVFCTDMAGADLRTVQELMGHKTIQMTLKYSHLSPGHRMDAVQRLCSGTGRAEVVKRTDTKGDTRQKEGATVCP